MNNFSPDIDAEQYDDQFSIEYLIGANTETLQRLVANPLDNQLYYAFDDEIREIEGRIRHLSYTDQAKASQFAKRVKDLDLKGYKVRKEANLKKEFEALKAKITKEIAQILESLNLNDLNMAEIQLMDLDQMYKNIEGFKATDLLAVEKIALLTEINVQRQSLAGQIKVLDVRPPLPPLDQRVREIREGLPFSAVEEARSSAHRDELPLKIINYIDQENRASGRVLSVKTGDIALADPHRELMTSGLQGCLAVFIRGAHGNALMHMTPSTKLGYSIPGDTVSNEIISTNILKRTMGLLHPALEHLGPMESLEVTILGNDWGDPRPEMENVAEAFRSAGVNHVDSVLLPFTKNSSVAYLPQKPDALFVMGSNDHDRTVRTDWITLKKVITL